MTKLIKTLLFSLTFTFHASSEVYSEKTAVEVVIKNFVNELSEIQLRDSQLYINLIKSSYKSSYLADISAAESKNLDIDFVNTPFEIISKIQPITFLKTEVFDKHACSFVTDDENIFAFSLINEEGWQFMSPTIYFIEYTVKHPDKIFCSALYYELSLKNTEIYLDKS